MNIFVVDEDPIKAAQSLCDAHVVKMIVESCQLLSTQDQLHGIVNGRYNITHENHPCRLCLCSPYNRLWLKLHLGALLKEYTFRYGKIHKCQEMFTSLWASDLEYVPEFSPFVDGLALEHFMRTGLGELTTFPQCMPEEYQLNALTAKRLIGYIADTVQAYRRYYRYKAHSLKRFRYTKREEPEWLKED